MRLSDGALTNRDLSGPKNSERKFTVISFYINPPPTTPSKKENPSREVSLLVGQRIHVGCLREFCLSKSCPLSRLKKRACVVLLGVGV